MGLDRPHRRGLRVRFRFSGGYRLRSSTAGRGRTELELKTPYDTFLSTCRRRLSAHGLEDNWQNHPQEYVAGPAMRNSMFIELLSLDQNHFKVSRSSVWIVLGSAVESFVMDRKKVHWLYTGK